MTIPPKAKIKHIPAPLTEDLFLAHEINDVNHIFCWAALADQIDGTTYTNLTSHFPTMLLENKQYIFVAYNYTTNAIIVRAIVDREAPTIVAAFDDVFSYLERKGFKPRFNVLDNEASLAITKYLCSQHIKWQFVPLNEHRSNAVEQAIQTFKNHFISGLCITDKNFPLQLWNHLAHQAEITCNLLRKSRIDPTISAYHQLHGHKYNWNAHPLAPPGTCALILNPPALRSSWGPRAIDAWYCGPAMDFVWLVPDRSC